MFLCPQHVLTLIMGGHGRYDKIPTLLGRRTSYVLLCGPFIVNNVPESISELPSTMTKYTHGWNGKEGGGSIPAAYLSLSL
jgi:hypothetical protein